MQRYLRRYYQTLKKYRLLIVIVTLVCLLFAFVKTMRSPDLYSAATVMELSYSSPAVIPTMEYGNSRASYWNYDEFLNTQMKIIQSAEVARRTIDALGFESWAPAAIQGKISVSAIKQSHLIRIEAIDISRERVALIANGVAQAFIDFQFEKQIHQSKKIIQWLRNRLEEVLDDLRTSENAEYDFAMEKRIVSLEGKRNVLIERLEKLEMSYAIARTDRLKAEAGYRELQGILERGREGYKNLESMLTSDYSTFAESLRIDLGKTRTQISQAGSVYGPDHPQMKKLQATVEEQEAQLHKLIDQYVENARIKWLSQRSQEAVLHEELERLTQETLAFNETWMEYLGLQQEVKKNQQVYEILVQRLKEVDLTKNLQNETSQVVEAAITPGGPFAPNVKLNLAIALILGLGLGIGIAFLIDYYDPRVNSAAEFARLTRLPVLVEIPVIGADIENPLERAAYINRIVQVEPASPEAELFRVLRTHLLFGGESRKPIRSLLVSGIHPKEGKSTIATNLAISIAQMERRVLLIDADIRRASLTHSFEMDDLPGLTEVLMGEVDSQSIVQMTEFGSLFVVPAGRMQENPGELLTTSQLRRLMAAWRSEFDHVIIDMAPILAVSDALSLAADVEGVLLVNRPGSSTRAEILATMERLGRIEANVIGTVLNQVTNPETQTSGYYYYYRRTAAETEL